jgi:hypothetical protein
VRGRTVFTSDEITKLRLLIQLKRASGSDTQKMLEARMQAIGFCPEDFRLDFASLSTPEFDALLARGAIQADNRTADAVRAPRVA